MTLVGGSYTRFVHLLACALSSSPWPLYALRPLSASGTALRRRHLTCHTCKQVKFLSVPHIRNPYRVDASHQRFATVLNKLHLWNMTRFDTVIFVDIDLLLLRPPDELFDLGCTFAAASERLGQPLAVNSGMLVVKPSARVFTKLWDSVGRFPSVDSSDQGFIQAYFRSYLERETRCSLPHQYNLLRRVESSNPNLFRRMASTNELVGLHFVGAKPWDVDSDICVAREYRQMFPLALRMWQQHAMKCERNCSVCAGSSPAPPPKPHCADWCERHENRKRNPRAFCGECSCSRCGYCTGHAAISGISRD